MLLTPFAKSPIGLYEKAIYVQENQGAPEMGLESTILDNNVNAPLKHYVYNII
jgi:hypothetical protein